jgi:hypothetical protein
MYYHSIICGHHCLYPVPTTAQESVVIACMLCSGELRKNILEKLIGLAMARQQPTKLSCCSVWALNDYRIDHVCPDELHNLS